MAIQIITILRDDAPPAPLTEPVEVSTTLDTAGMTNLVNQYGSVSRSGLQSYLMTAVGPLANAYEAVIASPPPSATRQAAAVPPEPLPTTLASYNYVWPDPDTPTPQPGQVVHAKKALDTLRVAHVDSDGHDRTNIISLVRRGDNIAIGTTTWFVADADSAADWTDFTITPSTQAAVQGLSAVLFARPSPRHLRR